MDSLHRIRQVAHKEILELSRHAGVVAFILILPIVEIFVLGYATAGGIDDLPVAVYDADRSTASRRLVQAIHHTRSFEVDLYPDTIAEGERVLDEGRVSVLFVIPRGFERTLNGSGDGVGVTAIIDGSNTAIAGPAAAYADEVIGRFMLQSLGEQAAQPVIAEPRVRYNQDLQRENFFIPGLLGTMLSLVVLAITAISIVKERERGTLEQLMVTPIRPLELILGKLVPVLLVAYGELFVMLLITTQVFHVPIAGSLVVYSGMMLVYMLAEMGIGILISTLARSQSQALPSIFLLVTMSGTLAGFFLPVEVMPPMIQAISRGVPLRYFIFITRSLFAKGAGFRELAPQLVPLALMSVVLFSASTLILRRRMV
jgi:ABC-2 type transport system permease protein